MERGRVLSGLKRVAVKVGSRVLTSPENGLDMELIGRLVDDIAYLHNRDLQVLLISSGAIIAGLKDLRIGARPVNLPLKQAAAAVGQVKLVNSYALFFQKYSIPTAQILLTRDDLQTRLRYLNARNTLLRLLDKGAIPIINENDTVAVEEIKFGDNDTLAALVALMMDVDMLIILTDIDGLYTDIPAKTKGAEMISYVEKITHSVERIATSKGSGEGGMETKIKSAKMVTESGIPAVIANGRKSRILRRIISGEDVGTFFFSQQQKRRERKCWIAFTLKPKGEIVVDRGAEDALKEKGKSLLPSGVVSVRGKFHAGDAVSILDKIHKEFARGLSNYSHEEIAMIKGLKSSEIKDVLGYKGYDEVIHRDNLVIL